MVVRPVGDLPGDETVFLNRSHHRSQLASGHQVDGLAHGKPLSLLGEDAGGNDDSTGCPMRGHQSEHLADYLNADLCAAPLLGLNEVGASVAREHQVDSTIRPSVPVFLDSVPPPPKRLAKQLLELLPLQRADRLNPGLPVVLSLGLYPCAL